MRIPKTVINGVSIRHCEVKRGHFFVVDGLAIYYREEGNQEVFTDITQLRPKQFKSFQRYINRHRGLLRLWAKFTQDPTSIGKFCYLRLMEWEGTREEEKQAILDEWTGKNNQPGEDEPPTPNYVYLMKDEHTGLYKIGVSKDPQFREKTLLSQAPKVALIDKWVSDDAYVREKHLHSHFSDKRVRGEWFELDESDVNNIADYFNNSIESEPVQ